MAYKALYRTYRPQTFEEVAGQQTVVKTIANALKSGKIAHAYLFSGPRGTGKTTMAKLLAKALNCEEGVGHQCNKCDNCLTIIDGSHPDVFEIDAASNSGVDNIRDLVENIKYSPIKGRYKVYIIDEVHMMSTSAFNALLKTLEEPPSNVVFILATTEPHKVLPTILSRVQRFDFSKVSDHDLKKRLIEILKLEKVIYDDHALDLLISLSDGGVRDALSMLDQLLAYSTNKLQINDIELLFGLLGTSEKIALIQAINRGEIANILNTFDKFAEGGIDLKRLNADLLDIFKELLIYKVTKDKSLLKVLNETEAKNLLLEFPVSKIEQMINILMETQNNFKNVANARSLFEISLLKMALIGHDELEISEQPLVKPVKETPVPQADPVVEPPVTLTPKPIVKEVEKIVPPVSNVVKEEPLVEEQPKPKKKVEPVKESKKPEPSIRKLFANIDYVPLVLEGDLISADEDMLINLMCLGDRDERRDLVNDWPQLNELMFDPEFSDYGALLLNGTPYVLTDTVLVLNYMNEARTTLVNNIVNQRTIQKIVERIVGRKVIVLAVYDKERSIAQKKFMDLSQIGRLPRTKDIVIEIKGAEKL